MHLIRILNENKNLSSLQIKCIQELTKIFDQLYIKNFSFLDYFYNGTFGKYQGKEVYTVEVKFLYKLYCFKFIIAYNQLEYYISKDEKIIFECNLEDFWREEVFLKKYLDFLQKDLEKISKIKKA